MGWTIKVDTLSGVKKFWRGDILLSLYLNLLRTIPCQPNLTHRNPFLRVLPKIIQLANPQCITSLSGTSGPRTAYQLSGPNARVAIRRIDWGGRTAVQTLFHRPETHHIFSLCAGPPLIAATSAHSTEKVNNARGYKNSNT